MFRRIIAKNVSNSFNYENKLASSFLNSRNVRNFGSLSILQKGYIVNKLAKIFSSRSGIYRLLFLGCFIQISATLMGSLFLERPITMAISDYMNGLIEENKIFCLYGVLVPGSIEIKRGSTNTKFRVTDFKYDLDIVFTGTTKFEFKEGETIVMNVYLPDKKKKNFLCCVSYQTNHSMEISLWQGKSNVGRDQ